MLTNLNALDLSPETLGTARLAQTTMNEPAVNGAVNNDNFGGGSSLPGVAAAIVNIKALAYEGLRRLFPRGISQLAAGTNVGSATLADVEREIIVNEVMTIFQQESFRRNTSPEQHEAFATKELNKRIDEMVLIGDLVSVTATIAKEEGRKLLAMIYAYNEREALESSSEYEDFDDDFKYALQKWYNPTYNNQQESYGSQETSSKRARVSFD